MEAVATPPSADAADLLDVAQGYLVYLAAGQRLAVALEEVVEVARLPELFRVPLSPAPLSGVINLRGRVLAVLDLGVLLGGVPTPRGAGTRLLMLRDLPAYALLVAAIDGFEARESGSELADGQEGEHEFAKATVLSARGEERLPVIDFPRLIVARMRLNPRSLLPADIGAQAEQESEVEAEVATEQILSFRLGRQEYAVPVARVVEAVHAPDEFLVSPGMSEHMLGLMALRDRLVPVLDAGAALDAQYARMRDRNVRVLVLRFGEGDTVREVGLLIDAITGIHAPRPDEIREIPPLLARLERVQEVISVVRLEEGRRMIALLAAERLFGEEEALRLEQLMQHENLEANLVAQAGDDARANDYIVFKLDEAELAVHVAAVDQVLARPERMTPVPGAPVFVKGVINLRGRAVPVIDARERFGLQALEDGRGRVLVIAHGGARTGILVDDVVGILPLAQEDLPEVPGLSEDQARLIHHVATSSGRMIMVVDAQALINASELETLSELVA